MPHVAVRHTTTSPAAQTIQAKQLTRTFGRVVALRGVSLQARAGETVALLGPNGAGKTTLLRILTGLIDPDDGDVRLLGKAPRDIHRGSLPFGFLPSGDRTFYLRISGLENLIFFGRLHGLSRRVATLRARECLHDVGLTGAAKRPVRTYSHGMQKRLSLARALLARPPILFADEPTHDLDPRAASEVRELVAGIALQGTTVLWATQRIDEIRGFAQRAIVLDHGTVRFSGPVSELMAFTIEQRFLLNLRSERRAGKDLEELADLALGDVGSIRSSSPESSWYLLQLSGEATLGAAIERLLDARVEVLACTQERSEIEGAFLALTEPPP